MLSTVLRTINLHHIKPVNIFRADGRAAEFVRSTFKLSFFKVFIAEQSIFYPKAPLNQFWICPEAAGSCKGLIPVADALPS